MPKFRKKPEVIEAEQWFGHKHIDGVIESPVLSDDGKPYGQIKTLEGWMIASEGDWIITGVNGEKYPCKPDIFAKTYEPVNEGESDAVQA